MMKIKIKLIRDFVPANHGVGGWHGRVWWGWHVFNADGARLTGAMPLMAAHGASRLTPTRQEINR